MNLKRTVVATALAQAAAQPNTKALLCRRSARAHPAPSQPTAMNRAM
jgi:hypothetical protein